MNRILTSEEHGKRIVVIENEAGKLSIDDKMLRAGEQVCVHDRGMVRCDDVRACDHAMDGEA